MNYENNFYVTHDLSQDIEFLFVDLGGTTGWRAYILSNIDYKNRSTSCGTIHRLTEGNSDVISKIRRFLSSTRLITNDTAPINYICWSKPVYSLDSIREVAKTWSEITAYYIKYGGDFSSIQRKLKSQGIISF